MKNKNNCVNDLFKKGNTGIKLLCICFPLILSCTSVNISPDGNVNEQLKGENRIMKKNLTLAVRENSVLKEENIQYKNDNSRLKTRVKLLESEMESLKKKYDQDVALLNEKYETLNKKNIILQQESSSKIEELTSINKVMEEKMTKDITKLNENIRSQEETFNKERAAVELAFSAKEQEYQKQQAQLNKDLLAANMEIESFKSKLSEYESNLSSARAELLKKDEINRELRKKIDSQTKVKEVKKEESPEKDKGNP